MHSRSAAHSCALVLLALALARPAAAAPPAVTLAPATLHLGGAPVGVPAEGQLLLSNTTPARIDVTAVTLAPEGGLFTLLDLPPPPIALAPGSTLSIKVNFSGAREGAASATVTVATTDPDCPTVEAAITASAGAPRLVSDAATVLFAPTNLGASAVGQEIGLRNSGFADLTILEITVGGDHPGDFPIAPPRLPAIVPALGLLTLPVSFRPVALGVRHATITVAAGGQGEVIRLSGEATSARLRVAPGDLAFPTTRVGIAAAATVTVSSDGNGALTIRQLELSGGQFAAFALHDPPPLPLTIRPGAPLSLGIAFDPAAAGSAQTTLRIETEVGTAVVPLHGVAVAPRLVASVEAVDFGTVPTSSPPLRRTITVANQGDAEIQIVDLELDDRVWGALLALADPPPLPLRLPPQGELQITVQFTAAAPAVVRSVLRMLTDDALTPELTVSVAATAYTPLLAVDRERLDFGTSLVGDSRELEVTLENAGLGPVTVEDLALTGIGAARFRVLAPATPFPVEVGSRQQVRLRFQAAAAGEAIAELVAVAEGVGLASVTLRGLGVPAPLRVEPAALAFGPVLVGTKSVVQTVTLYNDGLTPLPLAGVVSRNAAFTVTPSLETAILGPASATTFDVVFAPPAAGARGGALEISLRGLSRPSATVSVEGEGVTVEHRGGCAVGGGTSPWPLLVLPIAPLLARRRRAR